MSNPDVLIVGAGPAGSVAASMLVNRGYKVTVLEKDNFPRFSLGESLLPYSMHMMKDAQLLNAVEQERFQLKTGAIFVHKQKQAHFCFADKFSTGIGYTYQVKRARFDQLLIEQAAHAGAQVEFGQQITAVSQNEHGISLKSVDQQGRIVDWQAKFALDASGFGQVFARMFNLQADPQQDNRMAIFSHLQCPALAGQARESIYIVVSDFDPQVWYWVIPFSDGTCSVGVVGKTGLLSHWADSDQQRLHYAINSTAFLKKTFGHDPEFLFEPKSIQAYSASVSSLFGKKFALLGNAGEFIDPIFSSGVTIAMKSAQLATQLVDRSFQDESVNWHQDYSKPLMFGVDVFKAFVDAWYDGRLIDIVFSQGQHPQIKQMLCSILAGYAWDADNPYTQNTAKRLSSLADQIKLNTDLIPSADTGA